MMFNFTYPPLASKKNVGDRIALLREIRGWKQQETAQRIGVSRTVLSNWENGRNWPDGNDAAKLVEIFGVTFDYLFLGRVSTLTGELEAEILDRQPSAESPDR